LPVEVNHRLVLLNVDVGMFGFHKEIEVAEEAIHGVAQNLMGVQDISDKNDEDNTKGRPYAQRRP
jgi:hypothetical protein